MVLTLNLISLISRKALVPFEFDVHLHEALHKAVGGIKKKKTRDEKSFIKRQEGMNAR